MRKWIALLLALVMTVLMAPTAFAFGGASSVTDIWAEIERIEENAVAGESITAEARAQAYADAVDLIAAAVKASADYVPGSLVRNGDVLFWDTADGTGCGYSPRLRARIQDTAVPGADPEAYSGVVTSSYGTRGGSPNSINVAAFQPYYGIDSSFSTQYKEECESIAQATGGTATTYLTNDATIDNIANALETCAVVIFDSHGDTDYASGYDYTSRANTSYLCLQSGAGITNEDMVTVQGPYGTYKHAYYGGGYGGMQYYMVDGTAIANHMEQNSPNGLLWAAICLGMATDGLHAPLRAKGLEVAYGYSQSVTFSGDYRWEEYFWNKMKAGDAVKDAIAYMKQKVGIKDPYTNDYPAYPIVVSSEDVYPGHGNVDRAQTVHSTWTLFPQYEITARSNNEAWGTVSLSGNTITAVPAEGYYASGYQVVAGEAAVTQDGNVFEVTPLSDCTVEIVFAPRPIGTLTFSVPEGVSCEPLSTYVGDAVVLPTPEGTVSAGSHACTFVGWVTAPMDARTKTIPAYLKSGESMTLTEEQQTLYALYSYFVIEEGVAGQCTLVEKAPADWAGDYMITFDGAKALDASGDYTSTAISTSAAVVDLAAAGVTKDGKILSNVPDTLLFEIAPDEDGTYTVRLKTTANQYLADVATNTNSLTTVSTVKNASRWTISMSAGGPVLTSVLHPSKTLQYNEKSDIFRLYAAGAQTPVSLYAGPRGSTWYVTDPVEPPIHEHNWDAPTYVWAEDNSSVTATRVCRGDEEHAETETVNTTSETTPATCEADGRTVYTAVFENEAFEAQTKTVTIPAIGHSWGEPEWTWNGTEATATFTCANDASHVETVNAAVTAETTEPTCSSAGKTVYTATVTFNGETYTSTMEETIPATGGWLRTEAGWQYFTPGSGAMVTGWQKISAKWYYFNDDGIMQTGWRLISNKWYYFESGGSMATNWRQIGGKWYHFESGGAMTTGWRQIGGKWYYFNTSGAMTTGWQKINNVWYYFASSGVMQTGWLKDGNYWYYLQSSGAMAANTDLTINGKVYHFNANGVCTNP